MTFRTPLRNTKQSQSHLPDFVMIISVPNSLKRSHRSRLSKVAVIVSTSSETSKAEQVAFGASSVLLSSQDLSLFEDVEPST